MDVNKLKKGGNVVMIWGGCSNIAIIGRGFNLNFMCGGASWEEL